MTATDGYRAIALAAGLALAALLTQALLTLLLAVLVGVILALPLAVAADRAQRVGLPRSLGALGALALITAILGGLGLVLVPEFVSQVKHFTAQLPTILAGVAHRLRAVHGVHVGNLSRQLQRFIDGYTQRPQRLLGPLGQFGATALTLVVGLIVIAVSAFTLAVKPEPAVEFLLRLFPFRRRARVHDVLGRIRSAWLGWMVAVGLDMVVLGTLLWAGMALVGLPFAIGFATFSALMTVIPNYGSIVSAVPPVLAALSQSPTRALLVLIVYVIVNQIEGNLILPLIMARTVDMHPAVVAVGLLAVAALFGLIGVFIAIPLLSLAMILVQALWIEPMEAEAAAPLTSPAPPEAEAGA